MKVSDIPYRVKTRIWRDEQPGEDPAVHVSVRFEPRGDIAAWLGVKLAGLRLQADQIQWVPERMAVEPSFGGSFELRAAGAPTIGAGADAILTVALDTDGGRKEIQFPAVTVELIE